MNSFAIDSFAIESALIGRVTVCFVSQSLHFCCCFVPFVADAASDDADLVVVVDAVDTVALRACFC